MLHVCLISCFTPAFCLLSPPSTQLEKRSLPMEEVCHITMEVAQPQHYRTDLKGLTFTVLLLNTRGMFFVCLFVYFFGVAERGPTPAIKVLLAWERSSSPLRCVQNVFPQLRRITLTPLFVHFSRDQMKRERGSASPGPIRANRNGCLIYIAIRLTVFRHHLRLLITPVKNSMQWISCVIKSQFFLKAGTGSKLKDC